jgi:hypothetical protein
MAKRESERENNQRGKSANKGVKSAEPSSAEDLDVSSQAPSRVHIFRGKSPPSGQSKSPGEPLR